jgi:hypothetical protein
MADQSQDPSQSAPIPPPGDQKPVGNIGGQGQTNPPAGMPPAGFGQYGDNFMPPPPPQKEDTTPANYQIGQHLPKVIDIKIPEHTLKFDEQYFLHLLAGSISLTRDEKKRIVESVPKLKQSQVDELIRIFEEERRKFAELSAKHVDQLKKLEKQHWAEWQDLETVQKAESKKSEDEAKAEEIRKKLGL